MVLYILIHRELRRTSQWQERKTQGTYLCLWSRCTSHNIEKLPTIRKNSAMSMYCCTQVLCFWAIPTMAFLLVDRITVIICISSQSLFKIISDNNCWKYPEFKMELLNLFCLPRNDPQISCLTNDHNKAWSRSVISHPNSTTVEVYVSQTSIFILRCLLLCSQNSLKFRHHLNSKALLSTHRTPKELSVSTMFLHHIFLVTYAFNHHWIKPRICKKILKDGDVQVSEPRQPTCTKEWCEVC